MKKTFLFILSFLFLTSLVLADVFITELADPNNAAGARFVEIYNSGTSSVDLSTGYDLQRWTNANATPQSAVELTGSIPAGGFYIVCANQTTFTSTFGFAADQNIGGGGPADSNGDDQLALRDPSDAIIDFFGVVGEDGSGTNHEFEDGRAERKGTITTGNTTYTFAEWNIWNDTGGSGTTNDSQDAPADFDPGAWIGTGGNLLPSISNIVHTSGDITSSTTVSVSADVTDSDGTIGSVKLNWGLTSGSLGTTITMSNGGSGDTYTTSTNIPAQPDGTIVYYEVEATDNDPETSTSAEYSYTVFDAQTTTIPYSKTFRIELGACYTYSVLGASSEWFYNSGEYANINPYGVSVVTEEDWLIIPAIDFDSYSDEKLTFDSWYQYGTDDATNYLKLYYSADYSGLGDPTSSSWTELSYTQPSIAATWTGSGTIDLSSVSGSSVYIAFKYYDDAGTYRSWGIDNISVVESAGPDIRNADSSPVIPNSSQTVSVSADVTDSDGISSVELHWGLTSGSFGTTISMSLDTGDTYVTDTDIPAQSDGTTVYYEIYAVDNNTNPTTSDEYSYYVSDATGPTAGIIFISEVSDEDTGGFATAYMEIYNNSPNSINMEDSYIERWSSAGSYDGYTYTFGSGVTIPANGILIVSRSADQSTFETAWSITISTLNASFDQGNTNLYFTTGRSYKLFSPSSRDEIDTTPVVDSGNRIVQTSLGIWSSQESSSNATPGELDGDQELPIILSSFSAIFANDLLTLNWSTESELNNLGWNIYRSISNNLGQSLQINSDLIQGSGSTSEPTYYSYTDESEIENNTDYWYWLESASFGGETELYGPVTLTVQFDEETPITPESYGLYQNYPNPFNPSTSISFALEEESDVELIIYNIKGEKIKSIFNDHVDKNVTTISVWNGEDANGKKVSSGVYYYKLITDTKEYQKKMLLVK